MASQSQLNPEILSYLKKKLNKPISSIRSEISKLKRQHIGATSNAVAQIYAEKHGESVRRLISKEDKATIPAVNFAKPIVQRIKKRTNSAEKVLSIFELETENVFLKKHVIE